MRLGDLLRLLLEDGEEQEVSLARELELLDIYLDIARTRFPELTVELSVDADVREGRVPWLLLQPLVENVVRHGIAPHARGGRISISARQMDGKLHLEIRNDGKALPSGGQVIAERFGLGKTRARLQRLYGAARRFEMRNDPGSVVVTIVIPFRADGVATSTSRALKRPVMKFAPGLFWLLAPVLLSVLPSGGLAQSAGTQKPCTASEFRQFDIWVGDWDVQTPDSKPAGTNRITSILGGCAVHESWVGADGMSGTSFSKYHPPLGRWHQTWVDNRGGFLLLDGEFRDGKMTLNGDMPERGGVRVRHRVSWEQVGRNPDRVRQLWESSRNGGVTWKVTFDGIYIRKEGAASPGRP